MPFRDNQRVRNALGILVGAAAVALVAGVVYLVVAIRTAQVGNTATLNETRANTAAIRALAQQIDSCVDQTDTDGDPVGKCARQGRRTTAHVVAGINQGTLEVVAAALSCQADGIVERAALARCTVNRSAQEAPQ